MLNLVQVALLPEQNCHLHLFLSFRISYQRIEDFLHYVLLVVLIHIERNGLLLLLNLAYEAPVSDNLGQGLLPVDSECSCVALPRFSKLGHDISPLFKDVLGECRAAHSGLHLASQSVVIARVELEECFLELKKVLRAFLLELLDDSHDLFPLLFLGDHVL